MLISHTLLFQPFPLLSTISKGSLYADINRSEHLLLVLFEIMKGVHINLCASNDNRELLQRRTIFEAFCPVLFSVKKSLCIATFSFVDSQRQTSKCSLLSTFITHDLTNPLPSLIPLPSVEVPLGHGELHLSDVFDLPIQEKFEKDVATEDTAAEPSLKREFVDLEGWKGRRRVSLYTWRLTCRSAREIASFDDHCMGV